MLAAAWPASSQIWRVKAATEVLPLVPVTATMVSGWRGKIFAASFASARRGSSTRKTWRAIDADRSALGGDDSCRAAPGRIGGVGGAVGLAAGDRDEDHARRDLARIRGHSRDLGGGDAAFGAEQTGEVVELHRNPVVKTERYRAHPQAARKNH